MADAGLADTVSFMLNNLTEENVDELGQQLRELAEKFDEPTEKWLALFLIRRRISVESNHVGLYVKLVGRIPSTTFYTFLIRSTINYAQQLVHGVATAPTQSPRDLLRNLGTFLGLLTYGRDIELPLHLMDMSAMLKEAAREKGDRLDRVLPFLTRVLRACKTSKTFKPNHPHIAGVFNELKRMHAQDNVKMTQSFEIETLFEELRAPSPELTLPCTPEQPVHSFEQRVSDAHAPVLNWQQAMSMPPPMAGVFEPSAHQLPSVPLQTPPLFAQFQQQGIMDNPVLFNTMMDPAAAWLASLQLQQQHNAALLKSFQSSMSAPHPSQLGHDHHHHAAHRPATPHLPNAPPPAHHNPHKVCSDPRFEQPYHQFYAQSRELAAHTVAEPPATPKLPRRIWQADKMESATVATAFVAKDQKLVWDLIDRLDFTCSPVFQLYNTARGLVVETFFAFLVDVEKMMAPILRQLCDSLTWSAASLIYRDLAAIPLENPSELCKAYGRVNRGLLFALYYQRNANPQVYAQLQNAVEEAIGRAMKLPSSHRGIATSEQAWTKKRSARQFAHANADVVAVFMSEVLERFSDELSALQVKQLMQERRDRPNLIGLGRFCFAPKSVDQLNATLPEGLKRTESWQDALHSYAIFGDLARELKTNLSAQLTAIDPKVFVDVNEEEADGKMHNQSVDSLNQSIIPQNRSEFFARSSGMDSSRLRGAVVPGEITFKDKTVDDETKRALVVFREWCVSSRSSDPVRRDCFQKIVDYVYEQNMLADKRMTTVFMEVALQVCIDLAEHLDMFKPVTERDRTLINRQLFNHVKALALMVDRLAEEERRRGHSRSVFVSHFLNVVIRNHLQCFFEWKKPTKLKGAVFLYTYSWLVITQTRFEAQPFVSEFFEGLVPAVQAISPLALPAFSFAYLMLISQSQVLESVLGPKHFPSSKSADLYMDLLDPLLQVHRNLYKSSADLAQPSVEAMNRGLSKLFVYLHHDFPMFFVRQHHNILSQLPLFCAHMRNLVLSAQPELPSSVDSSLGYGLCAQSDLMHLNPELHMDYAISVAETNRALVHAFINDPDRPDYLMDLVATLYTSTQHQQRQLSFPAVSDLVLYVGVLAINDVKKASGLISTETIAASRFVTLVERLLDCTDHEGWCMLLNAMIDQLRFPNSHTNFFAALLLHLFKTAAVQVREVMITALFERFLTYPPYPFGVRLLMTELFTNPYYKLFEHQFMKSSSVLLKLSAEAAHILGVSLRPSEEPRPSSPSPASFDCPAVSSHVVDLVEQMASSW